MPGIGSLLHGLMAGMQQAQTNDAKQEALKLQQRHLDLEEKMGALQQEHLRNQIVHEQAMKALGGEYTTAQGAENNLANAQQANAQTFPSVFSATGYHPEQIGQEAENRANQATYSPGGMVPGSATPGPVNPPPRSKLDVLRDMMVQNLQQHGLNAASAQALGIGGGAGTIADMTPAGLAAAMQQYQQALNPNGEGLYRPNINAKGQVSVTTNPPHIAVGTESGDRQLYIDKFVQAHPEMNRLDAQVEGAKQWRQQHVETIGTEAAARESAINKNRLTGQTNFGYPYNNPAAGPSVAPGAGNSPQSTGATGTPTPAPLNKPGNQPTPAQGAQGQSDYLRLQGEKEAAKERGKLNVPLGEHAVNYIKPDDLTAAPSGMTAQQAMDNGYRAFKGANAGQFITMARSAMNILDRLDTLSQKLLPDEKVGPLGIAANWADLQKRYYARDPEVREYFALLDSNLAQFAKAAGDAANIAVPEQEFQKKALPGSSDTKQSAKQLIDSKRATFRGVLDGALGMKPIPQYKYPASRGSTSGAAQPSPTKPRGNDLPQSLIDEGWRR